MGGADWNVSAYEFFTKVGQRYIRLHYSGTWAVILAADLARPR